MMIETDNRKNSTTRRTTHCSWVIPLLFVCVTIVQAQEPIKLDQVGAGELLWKSENGLIPLPAIDSVFEIEVTGMLVHGKLTQSFHNPTAQVIEALYAFPLPARAAVSGMEIHVGDRRIVSVVQERKRALKTYTRAKESGRKAALVDQAAGNLFTTAVANINPGETVSVILDYLDELSYTDGQFSIRLPLTFTPRYWPDQAAEPLAADRVSAGERRGLFEDVDGAPLPRARIMIRVNAGMPLLSIESESHEITIEPQDHGYFIETTPAEIDADRDFLLSWRPALGDLPQAATFIEEREGERYALVMVMPPLPESAAGFGLPTETLFIIDVSGSMDGPSIRQARQALLAAIDKLRPEDRFNILKFNDRTQPFHTEFRQAIPETLYEARSWIRALEADRGTEILPALLQGLKLMGQSRSTHAQRIIFLTDGAIGNEQQLLGALNENLGDARLHTIGIGHAPNAYLMRKMAKSGRGLCSFVSSTGSAENRIDAFFAKLDRPVMTDVTLEWEGLEGVEAYPSRLPDLYAGQPLLLSAKLDRGPASGKLNVGGYSRDGWLQRSVSLSDGASPDSGVAIRWAKNKIESLLDSLHEGALPESVRAEVLAMALSFKLVTPYTSMVAVEEHPTAVDKATRVRLANALPQGGTSAPLRRLLGLAFAVTGLFLAVLARAGRS